MGRDNHACMGPRYEEVLKQTGRLPQPLTLQGLPRGFRLFASGNSYFGNIFEMLLCSSEGDFYHASGSTYFAYSASNDAMVLMIVNHEINKDTKGTIDLLKHALGDVDAAVLGDFNFAKKSRSSPFAAAFPAATIVEFPTAPLFGPVAGHPALKGPAYGCSADFTNCGGRDHAHTCVPGPVVYRTEEVMQLVLGSVPHSRTLPPPLHDPLR